MDVEGLKIYYFTSGGIVKAVDGVDIDIYKGEALGIAGESGCGKSTFAYGLLNLIPPPGRIVEGSIVFDGIDIAKLGEEDLRRKIRWRRISMIFQGAMNALTPVYKIGKQLIEPITLHTNISYEEAMDKIQDILTRIGLSPDIVDRYPHELSGGMKQRVMIAMALILNPDIVLADEPTTALDVIVQAQILNLLKRLREEFNITLVLISHDLSIMAEVVDRVAIMYAGQIVEVGSSEDVFLSSKHPYTQGLLKSIPKLGEKTLAYIPGMPPDLRDPPKGCRFADRCPHVMDICREKDPPMYEVGDRHLAKCWLYR
jgi:peptide/nickel transport system ATP-binding protein